MSLSDIVQVSIVAQTGFPTQAGFGLPAIVAYHTEFADEFREYSSLTALAQDGFDTWHPVYLSAQAMLSQNPSVQKFLVAKRALPYTQSWSLTPTDTTEGRVYTLDIMDAATGVTSTVTYTVQAADTVALIVAGLKTAIDGLALALTTTDNITDLAVVANTAGDFFTLGNTNYELDLKNDTADPGIAADLNTLVAIRDDWYAFVLDSQSQAEVEAAAAWTEARRKLFLYDTQDDDTWDGASTTDMMYAMNAAEYARTAGWYRQKAEFHAAGLLGLMLPTDPGSATWAFKSVAGSTFDTLREGQKTALLNKKGNFYVRVAGLNITREGWTHSGEYIDVTRGIDWMHARLGERVYGLLVTNPKLPYSDASVELIKTEMRAVFAEAIGNDLILADPEPVITAPAVADISAAQRATREYGDITFTAQLAGAIHKIVIEGTLTV